VNKNSFHLLHPIASVPKLALTYLSLHSAPCTERQLHRRIVSLVDSKESHITFRYPETVSHRPWIPFRRTLAAAWVLGDNPFAVRR